MNHSLSITILIPLFNSLRYGKLILNRALTSIKNQTYETKFIKVICLDDGSTDETLSFLKKWQSEYILSMQSKSTLEIKIITRPNKGLINTILELISYVDTDYFTILESDDYFEENAIENFLSSSKNGTIDIISSRWLTINDPGIKKRRHLVKPYIDSEIDNFEYYWHADNRNIKHFWWARAYRTAFIRNIDFSILLTSYKYYPDDLAFFCYVFHFIKTFIFIPKITYNYCYYENSISRGNSLERDINELRFFANIFPLIKKTYDLSQQKDQLLNNYLISWIKRNLKKCTKRVLNS